MDSTLSLSTTQMALSSSTLGHFTSTQLIHRRLNCFAYNYAIPRSTSLASSASSSSPRSVCALAPTIRCRLRCVSASAASGGDSGDANSGGGEDLLAVSPDVIVLDIGGMMCGGCADSVKRLLESRPQVSSASVNLTAETAIVWPVSEAKMASNWQKQLGGALAEHLTSCGFQSSLRVAGQEDSN